MMLPALFIKATTLSNTSLKTYLMFGILYSGSSEIYVLFIFVYISFFITKALKIIIIIAKKYRETAINPEFCLKK